MSDDETTDIAALREWVGILDTFIVGLDDLSSDTSISFCENASDLWTAGISVDTAPEPTSAAMWIFFGTATTIAHATSEAAMDQTNTPDYRNRITGEEIRGALRSSLQEISRTGHGWLTEGHPTDNEVAQKIADTGSTLKRLLESAKQLVDEQAAEDEAAAADPYGAILGYRTPEVDASIMFTKVCSFSKEENDRYADAYSRLQKLMDCELFRHVSDENERFCDTLIGVLTDIRDRKLSLTNDDAMDERRRKIRSALISFLNALQSHKEQSIRAAMDLYKRGSPQLKEVQTHFDDLLKSSFDYGWLFAMRDALFHGDINAFRYEFTIRLHGEDVANVFMDRDYMLRFFKEDRNKTWLKRRELEERDALPSILDMIVAVQPLMAQLQDRLDEILYPDRTADAATVVELIERFEGREGVYALQAGPGFTPRFKIPPHNRLAPRVLAYAQGLVADSA
ncbi:hypothetical protein JOE30_002670 [Rhodococcus sp. PvP016]|uniref:PH domain-containing protein n=1 Tax=Rhodococcoides corynebacterioides TaxID=53972 RepID=A0ABS2KRZ5_9NOCA|nr:MULTISPECIES: hypothetical protein [Rhodococcus]MBM7414410.1 hypothetical protein [Rhodococcus corynebacterioides]MBP1116873.1 hypothetical protein [Rhodococcus sp. PvP016]